MRVITRRKRKYRHKPHFYKVTHCKTTNGNVTSVPSLKEEQINETYVIYWTDTIS